MSQRFVPRLIAPGQETFQPSDAFAPLSLEIICAIAFGLGESKDLLKQIISKLKFVLHEMSTSGLLMNIPGYLQLPLASNRAVFSTIEDLHRICDELVKRYRDGEGGKEQANSLLGLLCDAADDDKSKFTTTEVTHNVFAFMVAGTDTTATALEHIVCCMASHPAVQRRLHSEVGLLTDHDDMLNNAYVMQCPPGTH